MPPFILWGGGVFNVKRRLGCIGCPIAYRKHRLEEFKAYPNMVKAWVRAGQKFIDTHPNCSVAKSCGDGYRYFATFLFYDSISEREECESKMLEEKSWKEKLEEYFNIKF